MHLSYKDEAVQAPADGGIMQDCTCVHGEGRNPARDHLASEVLSLEYPHTPAVRLINGTQWTIRLPHIEAQCIHERQWVSRSV